MESVALRYATSLFEIAKEENAIERYEADLHLVKDVLTKDKDVLSFFMHFNVSKEAKKETLEKAFKDSLSRNVLNFNKLLIDKNRYQSILDVVDAYHELYNEHEGIKEGIVYSYLPLSNEEVSKIQEAVSKKLNLKILLKNEIDESLLGGVKVVVENHVMDGSIKNRMDLLKQELLRK